MPKSQPISNQLCIAASAVCCCCTPYFFFFLVVTLKSAFYVNNQLIWCNALLPEIQAAFSGNEVQCNLHFSFRKAAHSFLGEGSRA